MAKGIYNTPAWRHIQPYVLARDGYKCQIRLPGCEVRATSVDHIVSLADGGAPFDESNLQAACVPCNTRKRHRRESPPLRSW